MSLFVSRNKEIDQILPAMYKNHLHLAMYLVQKHWPTASSFDRLKVEEWINRWLKYTIILNQRDTFEKVRNEITRMDKERSDEL